MVRGFCCALIHAHLPDIKERSMADACTEQAAVNRRFSKSYINRKYGGLQMNVKYKYEFVNETVEIEISEAWEAILKECDRVEYNVNHRETRRHEGLDQSMESDWMIDNSIELENASIDEDAVEILLRKAKKMLTDKQYDAFEMICIRKYTEKEYAKMRGISQQAAHKHIAAAKKKVIEHLV